MAVVRTRAGRAETLRRSLVLCHRDLREIQIPHRLLSRGVAWIRRASKVLPTL